MSEKERYVDRSNRTDERVETRVGPTGTANANDADAVVHTRDYRDDNNNRNEEYDHYREHRAGYNLSWGAIFAGIFTFIALMITLGFIGSAIGFGVIDFTTSQPFSGLGTGVGIWTVVQMLLSFAGAGFVSGIAARRVGSLHGFVTWAGSLVATTIMLAYLASTLLSAAGAAVGTAANVAGDVVSGTADVASTAITETFDGIASTVEEADINSDEIQANVQGILEDTGIPELQPGYLENQASEVGSIVAAAGQEILLNPEQSDQIINNASNEIQSIAQNVSEAADEQAIANAVEANTDYTQAEAEQVTANIVTALNNGAEQLQNTVDQASTQLEQAANDLQGSIDQLTNQVAATATDVTDTTSNASIWIFIGLVLSAIASAAAGYGGVVFAKSTIARNEEKLARKNDD